MWAALAGTGVSTIVFALLYFLGRRKVSKRDVAIGELKATARQRDEAIKYIERARQSDRDRFRRVLKTMASHAVLYRANVSDAIKDANKRGDGAGVLRLVSSGLERMRELSEAAAVDHDEDDQLHRGDREPGGTTDPGTNGV